MEYRAFPAAVFLEGDAIKMLTQRAAELLQEKRAEERFIIPKLGRYRANTDQIVLYHHTGKVPPLKADLLSSDISIVSSIIPQTRILMGAPADDTGFLNFLRRYWDDSFESDSPVTLLLCCNLRGELFNETVKLVEFHRNLFKSSQE